MRGWGETNGGRRSRLRAALRTCGGQHLHESTLHSNPFGADGFYRGRVSGDYFIVWIFYRRGYGFADGIAIHPFWTDIADRRRGGDCPGARAGTGVYRLVGDGPVRNGNRLGARVNVGYRASGRHARDGDGSQPKVGDTALDCCVADASFADSTDGFYWFAGRVRRVSFFLAFGRRGILAAGHRCAGFRGPDARIYEAGGVRLHPGYDRVLQRAYGARGRSRSGARDNVRGSGGVSADHRGRRVSDKAFAVSRRQSLLMQRLGRSNPQVRFLSNARGIYRYNRKLD